MTTITVSQEDINNAIDVAAAWMRHDGVLVTPQNLFDRLYRVYQIECGSAVPFVQQLAAAKYKAMLEIHKCNPDVNGIMNLL